MQYDLVLIDGLNMVYRNQHTIGHLSRGDGTPSGALYGTTRGLLKILWDYKPSHFVMCWDGGGKAERQKIDPNYKANRSRDTNGGMWDQVDALNELLTYCGLAHFTPTNQEADDLIAELAYDGNSSGLNTLIVSEDHDFFQHLRPTVHIYRQMKKEVVKDTDFIDWYGIDPWRYPEVMSITGDGTDNIHGIRGIGTKTAVRILNKYPNLHQALEDNKLADHRDLILKNYQLVKHNAAGHSPFSIDTFHCGDAIADPFSVVEFLENWEFNSISKLLTDRAYMLK